MLLKVCSTKLDDRIYGTGITQVFAGKVNLTLQAAAKIICESLNELSCNGVAIPGDVSAPWLQDIIYIHFLSDLHISVCEASPFEFSNIFHYFTVDNIDMILQDHAVKLRFYVMNFKGDWKYLVQLFNFRKNPSTEKARPTQL